ncbi:YjjG family noncanonical pyrimidine nucleotidase [Luteirhabdus pelagi]|uniref:YjjG family noncanonical pyrimidine nucleotidase n=1 Tax=Luteirhabdus pelagi TaxID=2792783 RepID=UPI001939A57E|nr:YjjG family noncanonical pyrimidine nucleotidase [Luteirhabdus pelagi]
MKSIQHVFFDLDHTLWDFDRNSALAFHRVFRKYEVNIPLERFLEVYEPINFEYWKRFREERVTKQELRRGRLIDAFAELKERFPLKTIDAMAVAYIDELPGDNHLFDHAETILAYLAPKYQLHIITNGFHGVQHKKLENSGIKKYFSTVTTSEEAGVKKPNPIIFNTALEKAKAAPDESIMIGDTFEADILGAHEIGMKTLFYNYRKEPPYDGFLTVSELLHIKNHL